MFRLATYIVTALVIVFLMVSRVDGGMIYASAYSDALNIRRSPALEYFVTSSQTSLLPKPATIPGWTTLGTASLSAPGLISGLFDVDDFTTTPQAEISKALADGINASALPGALTPWIESNSVLLNPGREPEHSILQGAFALTPHVYFGTNGSSREPPLGIVPDDYASSFSQLRLETWRDQAPVITAVNRDTIALVASLPKNNAPRRLPQNPIPRDAMLTPTVTEVVNRMLREGDDEQSLNGRNEIPTRLAASPALHPSP
jgi:hypothetical protein